jgi:hypothetical protein
VSGAHANNGKGTARTTCGLNLGGGGRGTRGKNAANDRVAAGVGEGEGDSSVSSESSWSPHLFEEVAVKHATSAAFSARSLSARSLRFSTLASCASSSGDLMLKLENVLEILSSEVI